MALITLSWCSGKRLFTRFQNPLDEGTQVSVAGAVKGFIPGKKFYDAMLQVWVGKTPVTRDFKNQILGK